MNFFEIVEYFLFAVLVALYEEPEKPNSALEYPFSLLWSAYGDVPRSVSVVSHLQMNWRDLLRRLKLRKCFLWMILVTTSSLTGGS